MLLWTPALPNQRCSARKIREKTALAQPQATGLHFWWLCYPSSSFPLQINLNMMRRMPLCWSCMKPTHHSYPNWAKKVKNDAMLLARSLRWKTGLASVVILEDQRFCAASSVCWILKSIQTLRLSDKWTANGPTYIKHPKHAFSYRARWALCDKVLLVYKSFESPSRYAGTVPELCLVWTRPILSFRSRISFLSSWSCLLFLSRPADHGTSGCACSQYGQRFPAWLLQSTR